MEFVNLRDVIDNLILYKAHTKKDEQGRIIEWEDLEAHTKRCEKYFIQICEEKGIEKIIQKFQKTYLGDVSREAVVIFQMLAVNIIPFHDTGKINPYFQRDKLDNVAVECNPSFVQAGTNHSILSAIFYIDYFLPRIQQLEDKEEKKILKNFLLIHAYLISRHHSDLSSFETFLQEICEGAAHILTEDLEEAVTDYRRSFLLTASYLKKMASNVKGRLENQTRKQSIWLYFYCRLMYSLMVASDYYATSEYCSNVEIKSNGSFRQIERFIEAYKETGVSKSIEAYRKTQYPLSAEKLREVEDINIFRDEMYLDAVKIMRVNPDADIYYLEAPTGSGKSNTSMNLSFQLIKDNKMLKKIYYVYPFNTLVEQNLQSLERIFGDDKKLMEDIAVINSITPIKGALAAESDAAEEYYAKILLDRQFLNYPMIVTTHVSIFDTMFGDTKESAFAFHQLAGSVIVLDEIQSYKNQIWGEIISSLKEITALLNMKVIIMSATLPNLHVLTGTTADSVTLIKDRSKYFSHPCFKERVKIHNELLNCTAEELFEHVKAHSVCKKVLIELIKKDTAFAFYKKCREEIPGTILYMSGEDSVVERKKILERIKKAENETIVLVATQVIEAGVDIDMDIGYKNIAKADSEEQFLGRINRSSGKDSNAYFFKLDDPKSIYRNDVRVNREFSIEQPEIWDILVNKNFGDYYKKIFKVIRENLNENTSIIGLEQFFRKDTGMLDFPEVRKRMQLIEENNWSMQVYLSRRLEEEGIDGEEVWEQYKELLGDQHMDYPEKKAKLSIVTSQMNNFIYQIKKNPDLQYDDLAGELFYIRDGEKYFDDGKLNRKKIQGEIGDFVDFI